MRSTVFIHWIKGHLKVKKAGLQFIWYIKIFLKISLSTKSKSVQPQLFPNPRFSSFKNLSRDCLHPFDVFSSKHFPRQRQQRHAPIIAAICPFCFRFYRLYSFRKTSSRREDILLSMTCLLCLGIYYVYYVYYVLHPHNAVTSL